MSLTVNHQAGILPQQPAAAQAANPQGQIGGMPVQQAQAGGVRRALSEIGHSIQSFFGGLAARFDNWQEGRAVESAKKGAAKCADRLADAMKTGTLGPKAHAAVEGLMKYSARTDAGAPTALAVSLMTSKLSEMSLPERTKACCLDFTGFGAAMKAVSDERIDRSDAMVRALAKSGLAVAPEDGAADAEKTKANANIDGFVGGLKSAATHRRLADLNQNMGGVFTIAQDGRVSGALVNHALPRGLTGDMPVPAHHGQTHTPGSYIEAHGAEFAAAAFAGTLTKTVNGLPIARDAAADFHRMNITFNDPQGAPYNTRLEGDTSLIDGKLKTSVANLRALAGSDEATVVLSSVLHQQDLRGIVRGFETPAGGLLGFKPLVGGLDQASVSLPGGQVELFDNPGQIGDADIHLSRAGNDFRVDVTWTFLATEFTEGKEYVSVDPSNLRSRPANAEERAMVQNCFKVQMTGSYLLNGDEAAAGRVRVEPGATFNVTMSGKAAMPS